MRDSYDDSAGGRLLVLFVIVGLVLQPGLKALARTVGLGGQDWIPLLIIIVLAAAAILGVRLFARARLGAIGLHRWAEWTLREKLYLWTVTPLAAVAFSIVFRDHLARLVAVHGWSGFFLLTLPTGLLWGAIQEFLYRGLLQTELVRRLGAIAGVLIANLVFCFGPLHFYHLRLGTGEAPRWGMLAAIFGIGLFFGILYRRSGNLWLPAIFHGIWPPNLS
ncbi:MAG TPA: CPBP family intramembrane glutamic endopeptidase [Candidatus Eisenbacteria bacterium]|nr:CPBP family intramembrane glutamic endopeptidase [Candidatus Eisenbacteria bacterium]